jgi:amino acid transporter
VEIGVAHAERTAGDSKYSLYRLVRLNFDLMTGFSLVPLQLFGVLGFVTAFFGVALGIFLLIRRLVVGAEVEGVFTLFALAFVVMGLLMAGIGLVGNTWAHLSPGLRRPRSSTARSGRHCRRPPPGGGFWGEPSGIVAAAVPTSATGAGKGCSTAASDYLHPSRQPRRGALVGPSATSPPRGPCASRVVEDLNDLARFAPRVALIPLLDSEDDPAPDPRDPG